ncbi:hypothetical protein [Streptomyces sp. RerS4]|uniref:hypothetical protein n=1 Tax=Streptomyces sp. RerS4 TaxID=2942449 RepID=UPI00201BA1D8|nr:hypothetical protein [Streptomyces sp. RerS4]UQW99417.1 hypothetical protein M4D82_01910 [Streptomyces sp. RerS4]
MEIPEKSDASGGSGDNGGSQGAGFSQELRDLYEAAGGRTTLGLNDLVRLGSARRFKVAKSSLSDWLTGKSVPWPRNARYVLTVLIPFLESRAARRSPRYLSTNPETWRARLVAAQAVRKSGQGSRGRLAGLARALTDTGVSEDEVRRILGPVAAAVSGGPGDRSGPYDEGDGNDSEAERPALTALRPAAPGRNHGAERRLDEALALLPMSGWGTGPAPVWLSCLVGALVRIDAVQDAEQLLGLCRTPADRARAHAAAALAHVDSGLPDDARRRAYWAAQAAAEGSPSRDRDGAWAHAAQALACVGEGEAAVDLVRQHSMPTDGSMKVAWRTADRPARIAVASGLVEHDLRMAGQLLLPILDELHASGKAPGRAAALLGRFAALLPAEAGIRHLDADRFDEVREAGLAYADKGGRENWRPETVLVHALLRIGAGEDPGQQVDWLVRDLGNRGTEHFPTAALAVVHAARGDIESAGRLAERPTEVRTRAVALTALAGHLARVPVRPVPEIDPAHPDAFTVTVRHLALSVTPYASDDERAAMRFLHLSLETPGWYHALPVLARVAPEAVARVRDVAAVHGGVGDGRRSG